MEHLRKILTQINDHVDFEREKEILSAGLLDSVELVEIIAAIEEEYGIEIPLDDIEPENFDSLEKIFELIQRLK